MSLEALLTVPTVYDLLTTTTRSSLARKRGIVSKNLKHTSLPIHTPYSLSLGIGPWRRAIRAFLVANKKAVDLGEKGIRVSTINHSDSNLMALMWHLANSSFGMSNPFGTLLSGLKSQAVRKAQPPTNQLPLSDWEHSAVPDKDRQPLYRVSSVWINFVFVPVFINFAFNLASRMTYFRFIESIFIGGFILAICSVVTGVIGQKTGLSAGLLVTRVFGSAGGKIAAVIPPLALIGWDSFSLDLVGGVTASVFGRDDIRWIAIIVFTALFSITATVGFRLLVRVSIITIPIMVGLLFYALILALWRTNATITVNVQETESLASAVTKVVGLFALGSTICSPDIQRFCRTSTDAALVAIFTFLGALPFLLIVGGTTALLINNGSLMGSFTALGLVALGYIAFLLLSWSSCDNDYYSAALGMAAITGLKKAVLVFPIAIVAAVIAIVGVGKHLEPWLVIMTTLAIPLAGVFIAEAVKGAIMVTDQKNKRWRPESFLSWAAGSAMLYYCAQKQFAIPPFIGITVAFVLQLFWAKLSGLGSSRSRSTA